jgi:DNA-binding NtrC family response regulator
VSKQSSKDVEKRLIEPEKTGARLKDAKKIAQEIKGGAAILIVDDEAYIRDLLEDQLTGFGYDVFLAAGGSEAIAIYKEKKDEIGLVLLDVIMPEMTGKKTNLNLKKINPQVKIILMSGYSKKEISAEITGQRILGFVQKPFKMNELTKMIAAALTS